MKKRILSGVLILCMMLTMIPQVMPVVSAVHTTTQSEKMNSSAPIKRLVQVNESGAWYGDSILYFNYDDYNRLISITHVDLDENANPTSNYTTTYTYDNKGRLILTEHSLITVFPTAEYHYNEKDQLTSWGTGEGSFVEYLCEYNDKGQLVKESGDGEGATYVSEYFYNEQGILVSSRDSTIPMYDADTMISNYTYKYDSQGRLASKVSADESEHAIYYNYDYKPFVIETRVNQIYASTVVKLYDIMGHTIWEYPIGETLITDEDGYLIKTTDEESGSTVEFIYEEVPSVTDGPKDDTVELKAYTNYPNSTIGTEQEIDIMFELYVNGTKTPIEEYSLGISNPSTIESIDVVDSEGTRIITFKGIRPGTSDLTFTENATGSTITLSVTVEDLCSHYRCINQSTSELSCCPIYVTDFECTENLDGTHNVKFNAYNTSYAFGTAIVYDQTGAFQKCEPINPRSEGAGVEFIANSFWYAWDELVTFWSAEPFYTSDGQAKHTEVILENIPENAEIVITADPKKEDYVVFYTAVDIWMKAVCYSSDVDLTTKLIQNSVKDFCNAYLEKLLPEMQENVVQTIAQQALPIIRDGITGEAVKQIYDIVMNVSEKFNVNALNILENVLVSVFQSGADTLIISAVPAYVWVDITNKVTALAWPFVSFDSNCNRGKIEIHCIPHEMNNYFVNGSVIVSQEKKFNSNTILDAYRVAESTELDKLSGDIIEALENCNIYSITLWENGVEIQPDGEIEVRVPVPEGADGTKCIIYRIEENGDRTLIPSTLDNDYLVFKTTHLSYYIIGEEVDGSVVSNIWFWILIIAVAAVVVLTVLIFRNKRKQKSDRSK